MAVTIKGSLVLTPAVSLLFLFKDKSTLIPFQRRRDPTSEHQKVQKRSQKIQSIQDKRRNMQKESAAAEEEMRKLREEIHRNEELFRQLPDKARESELTTLRGRSGFQSALVGIEMTWVVPLPVVEIIPDSDRFHSASMS